jgi:hypothetical protein
MKILWILLVVVAALINLAPALGAFSAERMEAAYGAALDGPDLQILTRHRAVLFGIVGGLLVAAFFHAPLRPTAYAVGFVSMVSFLVVAFSVGGYGEGIRRVMLVDAVGIASLAGAVLVDRLVLGPSGG